VSAPTPLVPKRHLRREDMDNRPHDFSDPESQRVLDAVADALIGPLVRQKARQDFDAWLANQQVHQ
jgi:hypothetical protein